MYRKELKIDTKHEMEIVNITDEVEKAVEESGIKDGLVNIFVPGSTGAITTIEYEPGLLYDLPSALERIAPKNEYYRHEEAWHDGNGRSHVKASIIGPSLSVPFENGKLLTGTWQQIIFIECDIRARHRRIIISVLG